MKTSADHIVAYALDIKVRPLSTNLFHKTDEHVRSCNANTETNYAKSRWCRGDRDCHGGQMRTTTNLYNRGHPVYCGCSLSAERRTSGCSDADERESGGEKVSAHCFCGLCSFRWGF